MRRRPFGGVVEEFLDFRQLGRLHVVAGARGFQNVPPCAQRVQLDAELGEVFARAREDVVEEEDEGVGRRDEEPGDVVLLAALDAEPALPAAALRRR